MPELFVLYLALNYLPVPQQQGQAAIIKAREAFLIQSGAKREYQKTVTDSKKQVPKKALQIILYTGAAVSFARKREAQIGGGPINGTISQQRLAITFTWKF